MCIPSSAEIDGIFMTRGNPVDIHRVKPRSHPVGIDDVVIDSLDPVLVNGTGLHRNQSKLTGWQVEILYMSTGA